MSEHYKNAKAFLIRHSNGFLLALQFLTIFPVKEIRHYNESDSGLSLLYYPAIGAIIGLLLVFMSMSALQIFPPFVTAVLVVAFWVLVTGALHIDGLADCADAWVGGFGSRQRTMEIMKDASSGPVAVSAVILVLLLKVITLYELLQTSDFYYLAWVPVLARLSVLFLLITTPYVREEGLGETLLRHFSQLRAVAVAAVVIAILLSTQLYVGALLLSFSSLVLLFLRHLMINRLGGCTGDTIGTSIELVEVVGLLVLVAYLVN